MAKKRLTQKQLLFVEAYMGAAEGFASRAAEIAGYKGTGATLKVRGYELMHNPSVKAEIAKRTAKHPLVLDRQRLQEFWSKVTTGEERVEIADSKLYAPPKMPDRLKASELLARTQGLFTDNLNLGATAELAKVLGLIKEPDCGTGPARGRRESTE